jgi:hypothetical protein
VTVLLEPETVPPVVFQVTAVLVVLLTLAVKLVLALVSNEAVLGLIAMETGAGNAVTFTVADACLLGSATLVAVTA